MTWRWWRIGDMRHLMVAHGGAFSGFAPSRARTTSEGKKRATKMIWWRMVARFPLYRLTPTRTTKFNRNGSETRHPEPV